MTDAPGLSLWLMHPICGEGTHLAKHVTPGRRSCRPCTGCCDGWVRMVIDGVEVRPGHPCPHSTGSGCDDYPRRPAQPCGSFNCGWILPDSPLPEWLKPDQARVIVIFAIMVWQGAAVDLAVPVGRRIPPRALNWLKEFSLNQRRPLVYTEQIVRDGGFDRRQRLAGHGPPRFEQDLLRWQREGRTLW